MKLKEIGSRCRSADRRPARVATDIHRCPEGMFNIGSPLVAQRTWVELALDRELTLRGGLSYWKTAFVRFIAFVLSRLIFQSISFLLSYRESLGGRSGLSFPGDRSGCGPFSFSVSVSARSPRWSAGDSSFG